MITRRQFARLSGLTAATLALPLPGFAEEPDFRIEIAPYLLEASPKRRVKTVAYNGQVPGPLLRMRQGRPVTVEIANRSPDPEVLHWHGLYLPPEVDGAMEEGTPMIAPGATIRQTFTPDPAGFRWFHTHTFAGNNLRKAQFGGQHGFLLIEPHDHPGRYDQEVFLGLHDWNGYMRGSDDGFMSPLYELSTINGKALGAGDPIKVKQGQRLLLHVLNSSPTDVHWVAFSGHTLRVVALDGNPVATPQRVEMLRLAPAERVTAEVELNAPGVWIFGETRAPIQAAGMGIVFEYEGAAGTPQWRQPAGFRWSYAQFAAAGTPPPSTATKIELTFDSKFRGHGAEEDWLINGRSYPKTEEPVLTAGRRYRLVMHNRSTDPHPIHLHRHTFQLRRIDGSAELAGPLKDVVLIPPMATTEVEFLADHPGKTLLHCHQQDHMDRGFMMTFRYAS